MKNQLKTVRPLVFVAMAAALGSPGARAQTAEELQELKNSVQQMQKTIDGLNRKIEAD
jgi:hypothetical protein